MLEPILYVFGVAAFYVGYVVLIPTMEDGWVWRRVIIGAILGAGLVYFAVRFVRWAWETPFFLL